MISSNVSGGVFSSLSSCSNVSGSRPCRGEGSALLLNEGLLGKDMEPLLPDKRPCRRKEGLNGTLSVGSSSSWFRDVLMGVANGE